MMVSLRVWGMIVSKNSAPSTAFTVRLVPSTVIEPLWAMYLARSFGARIRNSTARAFSLRATTSPTPSTWPLTRCPPRRVVGVRAFSRLTGLPLFRSFMAVQSRVSRLTSAAKPLPGSSTAVRHTPLTAMLSPSLTSLRSSLPVSTYTRTSPPFGVNARILPMDSMMPVNMESSSRTRLSRGASRELYARCWHRYGDDSPVIANRANFDDFELGRILHLRERPVQQWARGGA